MIRGDNVRALTHQQTGAVHTTAFQAVNFLEKHFRIDNNTVADNRGRSRANNAGRQQMQCVRFITDDHGMTRIVAAIETCNIVDLGADKIGRLALTFVAPLSANQHDTRHNAPPRCRLIPPKTAYPEPSTVEGHDVRISPFRQQPVRFCRIRQVARTFRFSNVRFTRIRQTKAAERTGDASERPSQPSHDQRNSILSRNRFIMEP